MSSGTVHAGVRMAHLLLSQEAVQKDPDQNIRVIQSMMLRTSSGGAVAATSFPRCASGTCLDHSFTMSTQ